jgi:hypothetical protein
MKVPTVTEQFVSDAGKGKFDPEIRTIDPV